ncbi:MAG TPA: 50S ribosomal protein L6 [Spirochaetota bacterium]|mgnify:CR=1 FL=1|nr:50S ribosomal protein L6 [Spirochaetota bacterium]HPP03267.1 50S ribosomal protein L6 [Spirochaetota bacterium]
MSRIGKLPIIIPDGVKVSVIDKNITIEGPKGKSSITLLDNVKVKVEDNPKRIIVERSSDEKFDKASHGLFRVLINNVVIGVTKGFEKKLEIVGTGFKANMEGTNLVLNIGFSHPIKYPIPQGIKVAIEENTKITISGIDNQLVGHVASEIRKIRPPEPYKGKGIKYVDEKVRRKAGKAAKKK